MIFLSTTYEIHLGWLVKFEIRTANVAAYPAIYGIQPLYFQDAAFTACAKVTPPTFSDKLNNQ